VTEIQSLVTAHFIANPRELSRATPQLQFTAERLAARILRTAKAHSVQLKDPEEMFAMCIEKCWNSRESLAGDEGISGGGGRLSKKRQRQGQEERPLKWGEGIKQQAEGFDRTHKLVLLKPPSESLWCSVCLTDPRSASRAAPEQENDGDGDARGDTDAPGSGEDDSSSSDTSNEEDDDEEEGHNGFVAIYSKGRTSGGWGQRRYLDEEDEEDGDGSEADGPVSSSQYLAPAVDLPFPVRWTAPVSANSAPIERSPINAVPVAVQIDSISSSKSGRTAGRGDSMAALTRPASVPSGAV
jgi:hypothetical protein